jgi:hypothetical protein
MRVPACVHLDLATCLPKWLPAQMVAHQRCCKYGQGLCKRRSKWVRSAAQVDIAHGQHATAQQRLEVLAERFPDSLHVAVVLSEVHAVANGAKAALEFIDRTLATAAPHVDRVVRAVMLARRAGLLAATGDVAAALGALGDAGGLVPGGAERAYEQLPQWVRTSAWEFRAPALQTPLLTVMTDMAQLKHDRRWVPSEVAAAQLQVAQAALDAGDAQRAEQLARLARESKQAQVPAHSMLARCALAQRDVAWALHHVSKGLKMHASSVPLLESLVAILTLEESVGQRTVVAEYLATVKRKGPGAVGGRTKDDFYRVLKDLHGRAPAARDLPGRAPAGREVASTAVR